MPISVSGVKALNAMQFVPIPPDTGRARLQLQHTLGINYGAGLRSSFFRLGQSFVPMSVMRHPARVERSRYVMTMGWGSLE